MAEFNLTISYCDKEKVINGTHPDAMGDSCFPNGTNYTVGPSAQQLRVQLSCCPQSVTTTLQRQYTCNSIVFTIPETDLSYPRYFNAKFVWADGTESTMYITQNGYYVKWIQQPIAEMYECYNGYTYYKERRMISYDNVTFRYTEPAEYRRGALYSTDSELCKGGDNERWVETSERYCSGGTNYVVLRRDVYSGSTWVPTERKKLGSPDGTCTEPSAYEYRWVLTSGLTICGEGSEGEDPDTGGTPDTGETVTYDRWTSRGNGCSGTSMVLTEVHEFSTDGITWFPEYPPEYRHTVVDEHSEYCGWEWPYEWRDEGGYECSGTSKYHLLVKYVAYDDGPYVRTDETKLGELIEANSVDCGYIDYSNLKYYGVYSSYYDTLYIENDGSSILTTADTKPSGRQIGQLVEAHIGSSVTTVGASAFSDADSLSTLTFFDSLTRVENEAFKGCSILRTFSTLNVAYIGAAAFSGCTGMESFVGGNALTSIGDNAFAGCESLSVLHFDETIPTLGSNVFNGINPSYMIYVPFSRLDAFKNAWPAYSSHIYGRIGPMPEITV